MLKENCFLYSWHSWHQMYGFSIPGNSDINFLELLQILQVKDLVSQDCLPFQMPIASFRASSTFDQLYMDDSHGPLVGFGSLQEWLTKLRKTLYLDHYCFIIKIHLRNIQMGNAPDKICGKRCGASLPSLGVSPSQQFDILINLEAVWTPSFRVLT